MRAMVLQEQGPIESNPLAEVELADPTPSVGQVRVRVHCCAVCRTDLHVIEGDLSASKLPLVPGHQVVGTVDRVGDDCTELRVGDRVGIAWLRHTCGACDFCQRGRENLCESSQYTGYDADGGYAPYTVAPAAFAYRIPDKFDDSAAAPLLCAGVIGYRALERANVPAGGSLLLVGFGSSGHIVIQLALHRGHEVDVLTRSDAHIKQARKMGATWAGDDPAGAPRKYDSAILFAPSGKLLPPILERVRKGGTVAIAGIHVSPIPSLDYEKHLFYERDVRTVTSNTRSDGRSLLQEAADAGVTPMIHTYDLPDANRALLDMKQSKIDGTGLLQTG